MRLFSFRVTCFLLAVILTMAAVKGLIVENAGHKIILPSILALALLVVGIRNSKVSE
jgi:hypothetical protein